MLGVTFGDITGDFPYTALTPATTASRLLGRGVQVRAIGKNYPGTELVHEWHHPQCRRCQWGR